MLSIMYVSIDILKVSINTLQVELTWLHKYFKDIKDITVVCEYVWSRNQENGFQLISLYLKQGIKFKKKPLKIKG